MHAPTDTIAAIATAPGEGGISIVRLSGPGSLAIADRLFRCPPPHPSARAGLSLVPGHVVDSTGAMVDEALLLVFRAPRSFTREDVIEIQGHGGPAVTRRILRLALDAGARLAEPGEFTRRAFMHGRIDLVQAEAVLDLIRAKTDRAAAAAVDQLEGGLTRRFTACYAELLEIAANLEATLDFADQELPPDILDGLSQRLHRQDQLLSDLLASWNEGHLLRDGAVVAIVGPPNAGKSTLLNALLERERAIVSDQPGTTRDTIEEQLVLEGVVIRLVDTAGLRATECSVERAGIKRSETAIARADISIIVIDASQTVNDECFTFINNIRSDSSIIVANKMDLVAGAPPALPRGFDAVFTSLVEGRGVDELKYMLAKKLHADPGTGRPQASISERHRAGLASAQKHLREATELLAGTPLSDTALAALAVRDAAADIATLLGREINEELLDSIFSRFCIGK